MIEQTKEFIKKDKNGYWNYEFKTTIEVDGETKNVAKGFFPLGKAETFLELCECWELDKSKIHGFENGFIRL